MTGSTTARTRPGERSRSAPRRSASLSPNAIVYAQTSLLSVDGGSGSDTFEVARLAATTYAISAAGPAPPAFPGNELILEFSRCDDGLRSFQSARRGGARGAADGRV